MYFQSPPYHPGSAVAGGRSINAARGFCWSVADSRIRGRCRDRTSRVAIVRTHLLAASGIRSILAARKRALRRERVIEVGIMGLSSETSPNARHAESRACLARRRNLLTSKAKTVPEIHENASIARKARISTAINRHRDTLSERSRSARSTRPASPCSPASARSVDSRS